MLGLANRPHIGRREGLTGLLLAVILGLVIWVPSAAHATGCEDSWTNTAGGSWFEGSNWSKGKAPGAEEEACITEPGTYTVEMAQKSTVTVKSLTVGGSSGTQTLVVASTNGLNAVLTTSADITNNEHGAITLTNAETNGNNVTVVGPIANAGTITSEPAHGGQRNLQGNLTNTGTLQINTGTSFNGSKGALTASKGVIDIATGVQLVASSETSVKNNGGKIVAIGTGDVLMEPGTTFTQGGGTTSGTKPVILRNAALKYTGTGKSLITQHGEGGTLSGNLASGQSLIVESTNGEHAKTTASSSFTSAGTITLTKTESNNNNARLVISEGTLTNSGTITSESAEGTSHRFIEGNVKNTGTLVIDADTSFNGSGATLTNEGTLEVAAGMQLNASNDSAITNGTGGKIVAGEGANVIVEPGGTFTEGAGTTSGALPVILRDAALIYTGSGESAIAQRGESGTLSGSLSSGQSLTIESTCGEHAKATASSSLTNAGTITLTNGDSCGNNATLVISSGTLTNSGKIITEIDQGGSRQIQGNLTNTGTLVLNSFAGYNGTDSVLTNEGRIEITEAKRLTVSNGSSFTNSTGGDIVTGSGANVLMSAGTTFTEGAGITNGGQPVVIDDGTLSYTGSGASQIALRGTSTLEGSLSSEQGLSIQSTCSENADVTAPASFTNAGTLILTNGDNCGNSATLAISSGTLTNSGKMVTEPGVGGARQLQGNLTNMGKLLINTNTSDTASGAMLKTFGPVDIASGVTFSLTGAATVTNGPGGVINGVGTGALMQTGGIFNQGLGAMVGSAPVILDDLALHYIEHGSGPIALRGTSTVSGNIKTGEALLVESTCSEHAVVSATAFTNNGVLELTNGDSCANNATLNLGGETLTNTGTLNVDNPYGGVRAIDGNLSNSGIIMLAAGETLKVTGNYTQTSLGKLKTVIAGTSDFGALSVSGSSVLAGNLRLIKSPVFKGELGQTFSSISSGSLTGMFALEAEGKLNASGLYYKPIYPSTGVTLEVTQATLKVEPSSGLPGSTAQVSGTGFVPGDTVELQFSDHHEVKTPYPSMTVNGSGEISTEITLPESAALKGGSVKATSTQTGAKISASFTVT